MSKQKSQLPLVLVAIFFVSFSTLLFELSIIRLFSFLLWYHFVFIVISISILGLGIGAWLLYQTGLKSRIEQYGTKELARYALILAGAITFSVLAVLLYPFPGFFYGYILAVLIPFIAAGLFLSAAFYLHGKDAQVIYFADLFGGGLGSLAVLPLLEHFGAVSTALFIALIPATVGIFLYLAVAEKKKALRNSMAVAVLTAFFLLNIYGDFQEFLLRQGQGSVKTLFSLTANDEYEIVYTDWSTFARTDVVKKTNNPSSSKKWIFTDGGAASQMFAYDDDLRSVQFLKDDPAYFPFTWGNSESTLIVGSGGGKDVLLSLLAGAQEITAVEINRSIVNTVRKFSEFNGYIYEQDNVKVVKQDARNFLEKNQSQYDFIYLPLVFTQAAGRTGHALSENYVFTMEAFKIYLERLHPEGRLAFVLHDITDLTKAMLMSYQVFIDRGLSPEEALSRIIVTHPASAEGNHGLHQPILILRNEPFTAGEIEDIHHSIKQMGMEPYHLPGYAEPIFFNELRKGAMEAQDLVEEFPFDVGLATDNSPFFYNFERGLPDSLAGLLFIVSVTAGLASLYFIGTRNNHKCKKKKQQKYWWPLATFTALGIGFMLVEITLIQKMILVFGNPAVAFSILLFILLISSGLGSFWASRVSSKKLPLAVGLASGLVALGSLIYALSLDDIVRSLITMSPPITTGLILLITVPLGIVMGVPFSSSIKLLRELDRKDIPLAWGINGIMSVLGSVLSVVIAMQFGFSTAFLVGALCYLVVAIVTFTSRAIREASVNL